LTDHSDHRFFKEQADEASAAKRSAVLERFRSVSPLFLVTVIIPTLLAVVYFGFLASDVYISESRFVVRSPTKTAISPLGQVFGGTGLGRTEENGAVMEYVLSRRALEEVNSDGLVDRAYSNPDIFFLNRFGGLFGNSREELYEHFKEKVAITEGTGTQVTTLTVRAFVPLEAQLINQRLLAQSEQLVNSLSERAQTDALRIAQEEVDEASARARGAALELANFRDNQGIVDPEQQSQVGLQMISKLQDELIAARTQLRQLQTYTPEASQIPFLQTQIRAVEREIEQSRNALAGSAGSLSTAMVRYQELRLNSEFADRQLAVALASLQEAQAEGRRKLAYIERISSPSLPDNAAEPRRIRGIIATFFLGLLLWGVLSMLLIGVREHRD
jgi:ABC-2 type transport system permease protein/capsular polysaccharide transport system permease protein